MTITFTSGISFSGAVSMSDAPPPDNTAAWFGGGFNSTVGIIYSTVNRITYANDTATASVRGPLNYYQGGKTGMGAAGNTYDGWFGGGAGHNGSLVFTTFSLVDRITYATDTATAATRGPLSLARYTLGAAGGFQ